MKELQKLYKDLAKELNSYEDKNYQEREFTSKKEALTIVTEMNIELKLLRKDTATKKPRHDRKKQVFEILEREEVTTIKKIADELNITHRNVSSIICYLRKDGVNIVSNRLGGQTFFSIED